MTNQRIQYQIKKCRTRDQTTLITDFFDDYSIYYKCDEL